MSEHNKIDLIEFPARSSAEVATARDFYQAAFGWTFTSYGDEYADTNDSGVTAGFNGDTGPTQQSMPLAVVYADDLEAARTAVVAGGGVVVHDIFSFPGGRRFHFRDPIGNELAVWGS